MIKAMKQILYAVQMLRERGAGFFITYFKESIWFDLRHGTRTFSRVTKDEQLIQSNTKEATEGLLYVASFTSVTRKTVAHARDILGSERFARAQFFDLGCGKGKALLVFAKIFGARLTYPAVGIEYDHSLAALATRNIEKCQFAKDKIEIYADSAVNVPNYIKSDTLIIYLYNSFQGETLRAVLETLRSTPHILIYVDPAEQDILPKYGYTVHKKNNGRYNADTWLVASSGLTP